MPTLSMPCRSLVFAALWIACQFPLNAQATPSTKAISRAAFNKWLTEDVVYIIAHEERVRARQLRTDSERDEFVEQFWIRRDPTPDTAENEFKEEHYRRIAYANEHFASRLSGWKTDRGRANITYGPPDEIDPRSGAEVWHYRYIEGIGANLTFEFSKRGGEYLLTKQPQPGPPLRQSE